VQVSHDNTLQNALKSKLKTIFVGVSLLKQALLLEGARPLNPMHKLTLSGTVKTYIYQLQIQRIFNTEGLRIAAVFG